MKTQFLAPLCKKLVHPARTAVAAALSLLAARLLGLPEAFWAPISTMIVVQTTLETALTVSWQRLVGTALGCAAGALLSTRFHPGVLVLALGLFGIGVLCAAARLERAAYRFAGITLTVVLFAVASEPRWTIAIHRFCEVSVGILVGVIVIAVCPDPAVGEGSGAGKGRQ